MSRQNHPITKSSGLADSAGRARRGRLRPKTRSQGDSLSDRPGGESQLPKKEGRMSAPKITRRGGARVKWLCYLVNSWYCSSQ